MKTFQKISIICLLLTIVFGTNSFAHTATVTPGDGKSSKTVIQIKTSAECEMCKKSIETEVGKIKGVRKAELDLTTKILTVEYNPKKTTPEKIRKAISEIGYDADDVKANNRACKSLPHSVPVQDSVPH